MPSSSVPRRRPCRSTVLPWCLAVAACGGGGGGGGGGSGIETSVGSLDLGDRETGNFAFEVWNGGGGAVDYALSFVPDAGSGAFLSLSPDHGTSSGEHDIIHVTTHRQGLAPGLQRGAIVVTAGGLVRRIGASLAIAGVAASASAADFGSGDDPFALEVWNAGRGTLDFAVGAHPAWLQVDVASGTSRDAGDARTLTLSVDRAGYAPGHYSGTLVVAPEPEQGDAAATIDVAMDVVASGGFLTVTPPDPFAAAGPQGGPFAPASADFVLTNAGIAPLDWSAAEGAAWLALGANGGTLAPGESATVTATIDPNVADGLPPQQLAADVAFVNTTDGSGDTTRAVTLAIGDPGLYALITTPPNPMPLAPYTALFSAIDSTAGAAPIVRFDWDFGDAGAGNPAIDEGMLVVHRFDTPGTFPVRLTVTDANGATHSSTTTVTVTAFAGRTFYVSASTGSDGNDGLTTATPFRSLGHAFGAMTNNAKCQPDRLLLKAGDTWTASTTLYPPKPCVLDRYGSGARPVLEFTAPDVGLLWQGNSGGTPDEWGYAPIVSNLHVRYTAKNGSEQLVLAYLRGSVLRDCTIENGSLVASLQGEGLVVEGCDLSWSRRQGLYAEADSIVVRRSTFTGAGSDAVLDHQVYLNHGRRWLLEDCVFDGAGSGRNNNAAKLNGGQGVVVRRCEARGTRNGFDAGLNLGEQGRPPTDNVLFEDCVSHHHGSAGQSAGLSIGWVGTVTVRNCVFHDIDPAGHGQGAVWLWDSNTSGTVRLYHNVFYGNGLADVYVDHPKFDLVLRNNVFLRTAAANAGAFVELLDPDGTLPRIDSDHNVFYWTGHGSGDPAFGFSSDTANTSLDAWKATHGKDGSSRFGDPLFTDAAQLDFTLQPGSPAIDGGELLKSVFRDRAWTLRPRGAAPDAGIFEH